MTFAGFCGIVAGSLTKGSGYRSCGRARPFGSSEVAKMKHFVVGVAAVVVTLALVAALCCDNQYREALSWGFTEEGAAAYAKAYNAAVEAREALPRAQRGKVALPTPEWWANHHPEDIDLAAQDGTGVCQCIARAAMGQSW